MMLLGRREIIRGWLARYRPLDNIRNLPLSTAKARAAGGKTMHDLLDTWLVEKLPPTGNQILFRGHIDAGGTITKQFEVVVRIDPIARLREDFSPYLGVARLERTRVAHGWKFTFHAFEDRNGSLEDQMHLIVSQWRRKVRGWDRQQAQYCSTSASPGRAYPMDNTALTVEIARLHGAALAQLAGDHDNRKVRVLEAVDHCLGVMIGGNLMGDSSRHKTLR